MKALGMERLKHKRVIDNVKGSQEVKEYDDQVEAFEFGIKVISDHGMGSFGGKPRVELIDEKPCNR